MRGRGRTLQALVLACASSVPLVQLGVRLGAQPAAPSVVQEDRRVQPSGPFALPLVRDARTLAETASQHLAAERWNEALADLQRLIDEHRSDVLPDDWRGSSDEHSIHPAYPGAASWATARLFALPREARDVYRERNAADARAALARARSERSRRLLVEVARRWPICREAAEAWWTVGDLELETGAVDDALVAYQRALEVLTSLDESAGAGGRTRVERALAWASARADERGEGLPQALVADSARESPPPGPLPREDADTWAEPLVVRPPARGKLDHYNLYPLAADDRVLVNTAREVVAVDAYTGAPLWRSESPEGWDRLSRGAQNSLSDAIAHESLMLRAAVGGGIVVATLQIPYSDTPEDEWQGIDIMEAIPQRRLFAYDVERGVPLWNHAPPLTWDSSARRHVWNESQGSYAQRMLVAGPPTVAGSRVLVPCYRMSGRIEYHVACYDVATGERLWSTSLVSGQRETNMFGRAGQEFVGPPVVVAGDRVVAQTDLGTLAALDLMTGNILWESLYDQLSLPKTLSYNPPSRHAYWRVAPPLVVDGIVLATPRDSRAFVAFHLDDGRVPWEIPHKSLPGNQLRGPRVDTLLGAIGDTVYFSGERVAALQKPGGFAARGPLIERWSHTLESERSTIAQPRALLTQDAVVVPLRDQRLVLDRSSGEPSRTLSSAWSFQEHGNLLVRSGALFSLNESQLQGFFDWNTLLARQRERLATSPEDPAVIASTVELLTRRAATVHDAGRVSRALELLREAEGLLEPLTSGSTDGPPGGHPDGHPGGRDAAAVADRDFREARRLRYHVLRGKARALADQVDGAGALAVLGEARELAPHPEALADTLFAEERILRGESLEGRLGVLRELEETCGSLALPAREKRELGWLVGESLFDPAALTLPDDGRVPIGLWVLLARADALARSGATDRALGDLHAALATYGRDELAPGISVATLVRERIARRLELDGRAAYAPFEERAAELLERALEEDDAALLERVGERFPHSQAASHARRARLELAFAQGDAAQIAATAYAAFSDEGNATEEDAFVLLRLARALGEAGNRAFERSALAALAREHPGLRSDIPEDEGATLAELARRSLSEHAIVAPLPDFPARVRSTGGVAGRHEFIGSLSPAAFDEAPTSVHVYLRADSLRAFSSEVPSEFLWPPYELPFPAKPERCAVDGERIVAGGRKGLLALDPRGRKVWDQSLGANVVSVSLEDGLVLVLAGPSTNPDELFAFDAHDGIPLWRRSLPRREGNWKWRQPVRRGELAVLFAWQWNHPSRALSVDLLRGRFREEFELGQSVHETIHQSAWIDGDGRVCVPSFSWTLSSLSGLDAYDTDTGRHLWNVSFPAGEELHSLVHHDGRDYLITLGASLDGQRPGGAVHLLDPAAGDLRTVVELRQGDEPLGLERETRRELATPLLFLRSRGGSSLSTPIRAIHLPFETRWVYSLPVSHGEIYDSGIPLPAVSANHVVLGYVTRRNRMPDMVRLVFLDKNTGIPMDKRELDFGPVEGLELRGLGASLFVVGRGRGSVANRIEILEDVR